MKTHPKLQFFKGFNVNLKTVKARFKDLCFIHHPDIGGDVEMMKLINLEYEFIVKNCLFDFISENEERFYNVNYEMQYPDIIAQLIKLSGIVVEIVGNWLWISGNTKTHKDTLKVIGCRFAPKKFMWYFRPEDFKMSKNKKPKNMRDIYDKYGCERIIQNEEKKIA